MGPVRPLESMDCPSGTGSWGLGLNWPFMLKMLMMHFRLPQLCSLFNLCPWILSHVLDQVSVPFVMVHPVAACCSARQGRIQGRI
jgi:hypothetical protein